MGVRKHILDRLEDYFGPPPYDHVTEEQWAKFDREVMEPLRRAAPGKPAHRSEDPHRKRPDHGEPEDPGASLDEWEVGDDK